MSDTLIPTTNLRFVERPLRIEGTGMVDTVKKMRVLQQMFETTGGTRLWKDVPSVPETEGKS